LGRELGRRGILKKNAAKAFSALILSVSIPCLSFNAFMIDFKKEVFQVGLNIFIWSIVLHLALIAISHLMYLKYKGDLKLVLRMLTIFGGVTVFGIPIVEALYGAEGIIYVSIFSISYRFFLYSYGYLKMSGTKVSVKNLKVVFLNPIILATLIGMFIWIGQSNPWIAYLRIDRTLPWLYKPSQYLAGLTSPLAWLLAGLNLSSVPFEKVLKCRTSWYYSFLKIVVMPLGTMAILELGNKIGFFPISELGTTVVTLMMGTPSASIIIAYATQFEKEEVITSNCSFLSTICSIGFMPVLIYIIQILK
jgi:hypothetical protein